MFTTEQVCVATGVSTSALHRYTRLGLLQRPTRRSLGKGHGTVALYADDTIDRLGLLQSAMARHLRGDSLLVCLWLHGYAVDIERVRATLCQALFRLTAVRGRKSGLSVGESAATQMENTRPAWLRARLPAACDRVSFLTYAVARCFGGTAPANHADYHGPDGCERSLNSIMAAGLGLPDANPADRLNKLPTLQDALDALQTADTAALRFLPHVLETMQRVMARCALFQDIGMLGLYERQSLPCIAFLSGVVALNLRRVGLEKVSAACDLLNAQHEKIVAYLATLPGLQTS